MHKPLIKQCGPTNLHLNKLIKDFHWKYMNTAVKQQIPRHSQCTKISSQMAKTYLALMINLLLVLSDLETISHILDSPQTIIRHTIKSNIHIDTNHSLKLEKPHIVQLFSIQHYRCLCILLPKHCPNLADFWCDDDGLNCLCLHSATAN